MLGLLSSQSKMFSKPSWSESMPEVIETASIQWLERGGHASVPEIVPPECIFIVIKLFSGCGILML